MTRRVSLTGGAGFLGRRLCLALAQAGFEVRALARRPPGPLDHEPAPEWVIGDLADEDSLERLVEGVDAVVHVAGLIKARSASEFAAVNLAGAERLARIAGGTPFIHVSSLAAREPALSPYAASKAAGEAAVRGVTPLSTIVRPPAIYGPGDRETLGLFQAAARAPVMIAPGSPKTRVALAHVDDVAAVVVALVRSPRPGEVIAVGGHKPSGYDWAEIASTACGVFGRKVPLASIPGPIVLAAGRISQAIADARGRPTIFTAGKAREILHRDWTVSDAEQGDFADFPYRPLAEGFAGAVDWYRLHGWLR